MSGPDNKAPNPGKSGDSSTKALTREERLAAKLRENLRRRKAQARAFDAVPAPGESHETGESHRLPKTPPES